MLFMSGCFNFSLLC